MSARSFIAWAGKRIALRDCDAVGDNVRLVGRPSVQNRGRLDIGEGTVICSRPVAAELVTGAEGALLIGRGVAIGYGCSIVAEGLITIGDDTRIGPFAMVCDVEDDGSSGWRRSERPIVIGRNARIGSKVTLLPGTYIPDGAEIAAGSVVSGAFEPGGASGQAAANAIEAPAEPAIEAPAEPASDVPQRVARLVSFVFNRIGAAPPSLELERISGWGAGSALRLLLAIEKEFGTTIPDEEWLAIRSLGDLVATVERRATLVPRPDAAVMLASQVD
jgi:acetyltransferase-like isoleucine patch superfamily enzyme